MDQRQATSTIGQATSSVGQPRIIDLRAVVRNKFPKQYAKVPGWLFSFTEWLICQKHLNHYIKVLYPKTGHEFAQSLLDGQHITYTLRGEENLPAPDAAGRYILTSNHPLGALDGITYVAIFGKRYSKFRIPVNDMLMYIDGLKDSFLPVNTLGKQKREDMERVNAAYHDPETLIQTFPAGFCSRLIDGKIQDTPWKKSVITQAIETQRDIIPLHFNGRNSLFFYGLERFRRLIGMKFNIGTVLLPWQLIRYGRNKHYVITVGKPIPWQTFTKDKTPQQWAEWLRQQTYSLK